MPELPEVETIVRELSESNLIGCQILKAIVFWHSTISSCSPEKFSKLIEGQRILAISRHGKWLKFTLNTVQLYIHLRMTGKFFFGQHDDNVHSHERVRLIMDDGRCLRFEDQRKFGRWMLSLEDKTVPVIGIDPMTSDFTYASFERLLKGHHQILKSFLLNQKYLSGLGNIYVDESLWEASLHPLRHTDELNSKETRALFKAIPIVLKKGIDNTGTTLGNTLANFYSISGRRGNNQHQLNVFRRQGLSCPRCGAKIERCVIAQRGTHICPGCQKN